MTRFNLIVCDPPYLFSDRLKHSEVKRGAEANYSLMSNSDIKALKIKELADPDGALLALWVPSSLIHFGLELMNHWGFEQKQIWIWGKSKKDPLKALEKRLIEKTKNIDNKNVKSTIKDIIKDYSSGYWFNDILNFGMGRLGRNVNEICLIGINNKNIYKKLKNKSQRTVFFAPNLKHSAKPEFLQDSLDIMFPDDPSFKKIEIFARRQRPNYICIGNEAPTTLKQDIRESIEHLLK